LSKHQPLKGISIVDLTTRLPGPLAASLLRNQGAIIYKSKNLNQQDPFLNSKDKIFQHWQEQLNNKCQLFEDNELKERIMSSNGAIITWKHAEELQHYKKLIKKPFVLITIKASQNKEKRSLHDLNALSESNLLIWHLQQYEDDQAIIPPPFLPVAGIQLANKLALMFCSLTIEAIKTNSLIEEEICLDESIEELSHLLMPPSFQSKALHNGLYPCYQIYRLKSDNDYLVLGAIEEKFWLQFLNFINLKELEKLQFDSTGTTSAKLSCQLRQMNKSDFLNLKLIGNCVSFFTKSN